MEKGWNNDGNESGRNIVSWYCHLFVQDPVIACARIFMIIFGFILAYLGFKRTLEPLIWYRWVLV